MKKYFSSLLLILNICLAATSCGSDENSDDHIYTPQIKDISIIPDKFNLILNENPEEQDSVTFKVNSNLGEDITANSRFYINNTEIESNKFIPTEIGVFQVFAKYSDTASGKELTTDTVTINVLNDSENLYYRHKVLVEDFTGTWCGWCTRILYALEIINNQTDNVIPVAIHNNDEFDYAGRQPLEDYLMIEGAYPFAAINRKMIWNTPQHNNVSQPINQILPGSPIGIKINSNLGNSSGTVDVSFSFKENISDNLNYAVYIVENGLIADQKNYNGDLYGGVPVLHGFVHNHTVRGAYGNIIGNNLGQNATAGSEITFSNLAITYTCQNSSNLQVVAFIMNSQGKVLNVQIANGNELKDYEYAN